MSAINSEGYCMKRLLFGLFAIAGIVGLFFSAASLQAQDNSEERITLSPAVSRPDLTAGESAQGVLTIINDGSQAYEFVLYARPFSVINENYDPDYKDVNPRTEAYQWVQFDQTNLSLEPNERVQVEYTVTVPERAAAGGHYAVLFAETQPNESEQSVARKKRVGSLLYMTIDGDIIREGSVESWDTRFLQTNAPVTSNLRIENSGNVHFQADTSVIYKNLFGKKQFELKQENLILPETTRLITASWDNGPYMGVFKASGVVAFLDGSEELAEQWVVLFPTSLMIIIALIVVAIIVWTVVLRPKLKQRKHKK